MQTFREMELALEELEDGLLGRPDVDPLRPYGADMREILLRETLVA
jgi:hypothetical protein